MKSRILYYDLISGLSILSALGSFLCVIYGVICLIHYHAFIGILWGIAFGLFVAAIILYGLWDVGTRTLRIEEGQRRLISVTLRNSEMNNVPPKSR